MAEKKKPLKVKAGKKTNSRRKRAGNPGIAGLGDYIPLWMAKSTAAIEGNRQGRPPIYDNPEEILLAAHEYFNWNDSNPLWEEKAFCHQGVVTKVRVNKMRIMTMEALWLFMLIQKTNWVEYKAKGGDYLSVCTHIETVIRDQKLSGASADLLNANIVARLLGLADKKDIDLKLPKAIKVKYE